MASKVKKVIPHSVLKYPRNINEFKIYEHYINRLRCNTKKWSLYPNFGENFIIENRYDSSIKYKIINSKYKSVRNAKFLVKSIRPIEEEVQVNHNLNPTNKLLELKTLISIK